MNVKKLIREEIEKMMESSLGRIYQHMKGENTFVMLSPFRGNLSPQENAQRYQQLKDTVRSMQLGYIELKGGYTEEDGEGNQVSVKEDSLLIPNISKENAIKIGQTYQQDSVLFKDESGDIALISTDNRTGVPIGQSMMDFDPEYDFSSDTHEFFYSALKKGSQAGKKFAIKGK